MNAQKRNDLGEEYVDNGNTHVWRWLENIRFGDGFTWTYEVTVTSIEPNPDPCFGEGSWLVKFKTPAQAEGKINVRGRLKVRVA